MLSNKIKVGAIALSLSLIPLLADYSNQADSKILSSKKIVSDSIAKAVTLNQGWDWETQQNFWFTTQGSRFMPYNWFLWLEQENSTELFRSPKNMERYKYIPQKPTKINPHGLPIGFVKDINKENKKDKWVGLTCSACHTGQVNYGETAMVIDGAPTMADFQTFFKDLEKSMKETQNNDTKFKRFSINVLGENYSDEKAKNLKSRFFKITNSISDRNKLNETKNPYGFARVDAFGQIFNMVSAHDLGVAQNKAEPNAPVSYPFLWDTPQSNLVQWNGLLSNSGIGPLGRNIGEVLGVFGTLDIIPGSFTGYPSSAKIKNLNALEKWVQGLWSPKWPENYLGEIDLVKAKRGEEHYNNSCLSCHSIIDRTSPDRRVNVTMVGLKDIGTDPNMAINAGRQGSTDKLDGKPISNIEYLLSGELKESNTFKAKDFKAFILANAVEGAMVRGLLEHSNIPIDNLKSTNIEDLKKELQKLMVATLNEVDNLKIAKSDFNPIATPSYKARSLNGIWATAPYLHNGAIPNMWELLKPSNKRVKSFYVGSREFDPKHIGFDMKKDKEASKFDTTLYNNSNFGHDYGVDLSKKQKWELMEFLKTL